MPPIFGATLAVLAGDGLGNFRFHLPLPFAIAMAVGAILLFMAARPAPAMVAAWIGIAAAATVPVHRLLEPPRDSTSIRRYADGARVTIEGRLVREVERYHGRMHLYVRVERASEDPEPVRPAGGLVRVTLLYSGDFRLGEEVRVASRIRFPRNYGNPGEFDYRAYLARQGITATMVVANRHGSGESSLDLLGYHPALLTSSIETIRGRTGAFIDSTLEYPERAVMRALIIGDRGGIDEDLRQSFALTGMAHLLVISGLHLSFVAAAAFAASRLILAFFPVLMITGRANKLSAISAAIAVTAYASIAGHHVSTLRALVMVLAYLLAVVIDRAREVLASLALAALAICITLPGSTADIGFELSFASVLAIVLGMRRFAAWWERRLRFRVAPGSREPLRYRAPQLVCGYVAVSFWALLGTAPLTAYHFNQFAIVGLVANAIVVPIMGFAGPVLGLAAVVLCPVCAPLARLLMWTAGRLIATGIFMAGWFVRWPLAWTRTFTPTLAELAIVYALLLLWMAWPIADSRDVSARATPSPARSTSARFRRLALCALLAALCVDATWWLRQRYFCPDLRVAFLSVGQGDAAVVRFPGSRVMLIDGGGQFGEFDTGERILAPYLWSNKIMRVDYLVLSHPELDHFGGFQFIAGNFHPEHFWTVSSSSPDIKYLDLLSALARSGAALSLLDSSSPRSLIAGTEVRCLSPRRGDVESRNNGSMVLRLSYGPTTILFTGDLEAKGERGLIASGADLRATILKAPHHGSATSSTEEFVELVHPSLAVISDGYHNRFGLPAPEVVERYQAIGADVLRTDRDGAVMVEANRTGMRFWTAGNERPDSPGFKGLTAF